MSLSGHPLSPLFLLSSLHRNLDLVLQMTKREVIGRYRGSVIGLLWSFVHPFLMLAIYTFVFSVVFQVRWGQQIGSRADFAVVLFAGLIVHSFFSECITRAPWLVLSNVNYVKKVVFPLEILPWASILSALFHMGMSLVVLLIFYGAIHLSVHWTIVFLPIVFLPFLFLTLGLTWFLAAFGVYVRDVAQVVGIASTALLFLSPILYPMSAVPQEYRVIIELSPLTFIINQTRAVVLWGELPNWQGLASYYALGLGVAWAGFAWFQKTRRGFADVL